MTKAKKDIEEAIKLLEKWKSKNDHKVTPGLKKATDRAQNFMEKVRESKIRNETDIDLISLRGLGVFD